MKSFFEYKLATSTDPNVSPDQNVWKKWRSLVNMTEKEIKSFYETEYKDEVDSDLKKKTLEMMIKLISTGKTFDDAEKKWTSDMWKMSRSQIKFIEKIKAIRKRMVGNPFERNGELTKWLKSMLAWGHDPRKKNQKLV